MRNKPLVNREVILPGFVSGVMWAVAQTSWFVANDNLQLNVAFPIITTGPGLVAALWGVLVFQVCPFPPCQLFALVLLLFGPNSHRRSANAGDFGSSKLRPSACRVSAYNHQWNLRWDVQGLR